jgi:superfamily II DNA/RNA helicase
VGQIQGDMDQSNRIAEFDRFKKDEITILVASDVAARGLDVKGVSHVINFDVPWQPDDYIHRIGRTGRAGMKGIAYTLATREDAEQVAAIEKLTGLKLARVDGEAKAPPESVQEPAREERPSKQRSRGRGRRQRTEPADPQPAPTQPMPHEPIAPRLAADASPAWNGPVPGFLSFSAL